VCVGPRLLQVHVVGEIERRELIGFDELLAQRGEGTGARDARVDPPRERHDQDRFVQFRPAVDVQHSGHRTAPGE
jgi:hypothetical protein